jgi:hypothetical protein
MIALKNKLLEIFDPEIAQELSSYSWSKGKFCAERYWKKVT